MARKTRTTQISQGIVDLLYPVTIIGAFMITVCLPLLLTILFLKPSFFAIGLWWLCLLPLGPAAIAALAAVGEYARTKTPGLYRHAWRFMRRNFQEGLRIWLPVWIFTLPLMLYSRVELTAGPRWLYFLLPASMLIGLFVSILLLTVWLIASAFTFKTSDYWRLAIGGLANHKMMLLANAIIALVGLCIGVWVSPLVLIVLASCLLVPLYYLNTPLLDWIKTNFTNSH